MLIYLKHFRNYILNSTPIKILVEIKVVPED